MDIPVPDKFLLGYSCPEKFLKTVILYHYIITYYFHFCNSIANVFLQTQLFLYMMKKSKYNEHNAAMKCFTVKKGVRLNRAPVYMLNILPRV